jgi:hypothetical protein
MSNPFFHVNAKPKDTKRLLGIDYDQLQELIRNAENIHLKREGDTGYKGEAQIATPHKKSKKKELTSQQKEENTGFAQKRIYVEHTIRVIKIFRVAQQRF